jgi:RND family efflux transporter MFP subunit
MLFLACSSEKKSQNEKAISTVFPNEINEVRAMLLGYTDFMHELIANGTASARNKADLKFPATENISAIYVKNGDRVTKGQPIACLDPFKLQNDLSQAKDNLERNRLALQDVLIGQGYSPGDSATIPPEIMQLAKVKSNFEQANIQYELADYNYKHSVLYAPFSGVVANLFAKVYNLPDATQPFCTIIDNSSLEADFMLLENELALVRVGDKIQASPFSASESIYDGRITEINPMVDKNGMVRVKAALNNINARLYDGMNVKIRIQRSIGRQLVIPKEALVLRSNKKVVFTLKEGKAQWAYVQTGWENSTGYVVTEGLNVGDSVIYEGNINLAHESPVILK